MHPEQKLERAGVGAFQAGLNAVKEVERAGGQAFKGLGERLGGSKHLIFVAVFDFLGATLLDVGDGVGQELGFDEGEAIEAPFGGDDFVNQVGFGGAGRAKLLEVGIEETLKVGGVFRGEDQGLAGEAVAKSVLRRALFADLGFRAMGFGAVFAGGLGFAKRRHFKSPRWITVAWARVI